MCCIHKKKRATPFLEEIESGIMRCTKESPCKVSNDPEKRARDYEAYDDRRSTRRRTDREDFCRGGSAEQLSDEQRAYLYQEGMLLMCSTSPWLEPTKFQGGS